MYFQLYCKSHCFWRNLHHWQRFYTAADSDGMDKSHPCGPISQQNLSILSTIKSINSTWKRSLRKKQVHTHLPVYSKGILSVNHTRFHREKSLGSPLDSIKKHCQRHNGPTDMIFVQSFTQPDFQAKISQHFNFEILT